MVFAGFGVQEQLTDVGIHRNLSAWSQVSVRRTQAGLHRRIVNKAIQPTVGDEDAVEGLGEIKVPHIALVQLHTRSQSRPSPLQ